MIKRFKNICLIIIVLFMSCNNKYDGDTMISEPGIVGQYCSEYYLGSYNVEERNSGEYFLEESWHANFSFLLIDDIIRVPKQTVKRERVSPGGSTYYIYVTLEGSGVYYPANNTLYFKIQEGNYLEKIWLRKQDIVPLEGTYHSSDNDNNRMEISNVPQSDSLQLKLVFSKRIIHADSSETILYSYWWDMLFEDN